MKIGLLGGSFNPAHAGHRYISVEAMKRLGLSEVWWLVSPVNPLKDPKSLADYETRLKKAKEMAAHPRIRISDIERKFGTYFTIDTLRALKRKYPGVHFVWLMGADNLLTFHRWKDWQQIARAIPIAVFDRKPYTHRALRGKVAVALQKWRRSSLRGPQGRGNPAAPRLRRKKTYIAPTALWLDCRVATLLAMTKTSWTYLFLPPNPCSATHLRKTLGMRAFLRHNKDGITA